MKLKDRIRERYKNSKFITAVLDNYGFRTVVFFLLGVIINIVMASLNAAIGVINRSIWYGAMALYLIAIVLQKILLLVTGYFVKRKSGSDSQRYYKSKLKIYLANGGLLLLFQLALTLAIIQFVTAEKPVKSGEIIAIANAAYAFYKIIFAIINLKKTSKLKNPLLQTMRNINFADAAVSMLSLTATMISTFDEGSDMKPMLVAVAVGVSIIVIGMGAFMIISAVKKLKADLPEEELSKP